MGIIEDDGLDLDDDCEVCTCRDCSGCGEFVSDAGEFVEDIDMDA